MGLFLYLIDKVFVNVIVIVEKDKPAYLFPSVAYQIQNERGSRFRTFASEIKRVTPIYF